MDMLGIVLSVIIIAYIAFKTICIAFKIAFKVIEYGFAAIAWVIAKYLMLYLKVQDWNYEKNKGPNAPTYEEIHALFVFTPIFAAIAIYLYL